MTRIKLNLLFKISYVNSNFALTLDYLNPALNNSALGSNFAQLFWQFVSVRVKILSITNVVASRDINRGKVSLPVVVYRPESCFLKLPIMIVKMTLFTFTLDRLFFVFC